LDSEECVCKIAKLLKAMAWAEGKIGYGAGWGQKPDDDGNFPFPAQNTKINPRTGKAWIDTEDVMQVANPDEVGGGIDKKVGEIKRVFGTNFTNIPTNYSYMNVTGEQSIFYGAGWFFLKMKTKTTNRICACDDDTLKETVGYYNANTSIDHNGSEHWENYRDSVWELYSGGTFTRPTTRDTGEEDTVTLWTEE
jgi:hypothetical protein